jgi:hypothetical protein
MPFGGRKLWGLGRETAKRLLPTKSGYCHYMEMKRVYVGLGDIESFY